AQAAGDLGGAAGGERATAGMVLAGDRGRARGEQAGRAQETCGGRRRPATEGTGILMFERFTREARAVAVGAQNHARALSHHHIGTEHVLLALLDETSGAPASILTQAGLDQRQAKTQLLRLLKDSADRLNESDAEALESIGIDLNAVKAKIEEAFGPGAFEPVLVPKRRWWFGRKRLVRSPGWHLPFTPRAKKVLELSLREAL